MSFKIYKSLKLEDNCEVLTILVKHDLNKDQWKNRLLLFKENSPVFVNYKKELLKQLNT